MKRVTYNEIRQEIQRFICTGELNNAISSVLFVLDRQQQYIDELVKDLDERKRRRQHKLAKMVLKLKSYLRP